MACGDLTGLDLDGWWLLDLLTLCTMSVKMSGKKSVKFLTFCFFFFRKKLQPLFLLFCLS